MLPLGAAEDLTEEGPAPTGVVAGLREAGPIAIAGLVANAANVLVTVVVARLLTSRGYGELAQLNGVFLFLSMPGSALLVGVVRRATALRTQGRSTDVHRFAVRLHRIAVCGVVLLILCSWILEDVIARALRLGSPGGIVPIVTAAGFWLALSIDRGLLQARRAYRPLAANLIVEGGMRMILVLALTGAGLGVTGACIGVMLGEAAAAAHARFESSRRWEKAPIVVDPADASGWAGSADTSRRRLTIDVSTAFGCLAFLALLQNLDVIMLGREAPKHSGDYAAISVAAKALVFGAIALGAYLLPEATIRWHRGEHALKQLATTALILAVPTFALLIAALVAPRLLLRTAFGARLDGSYGSLATLVVAMAFLCATVLLTNYLLGAGRRWIVLLLGAGTVGLGFAVWGAHGDPAKTARADLMVQAVLMALLAVGFLRVHQVGPSGTGLESLPAQELQPDGPEVGQVPVKRRITRSARRAAVVHRSM